MMGFRMTADYMVIRASEPLPVANRVNTIEHIQTNNFMLILCFHSTKNRQVGVK